MLLVQNLHPIGGVDIMGNREDVDREGDSIIGQPRGGCMRMEDHHHSDHNLAVHLQTWHRVFVDCDVYGSSIACNNDDRAEELGVSGGTKRSTHQLSGDTEEMVDMVLEYRKESYVLLQTIYSTWPGERSNCLDTNPTISILP